MQRVIVIVINRFILIFPFFIVFFANR
jgi:hypothetical protein